MQFTLDGFSELTSVYIGNAAFESKPSYISIWNCSKLQSIYFDQHAFQKSNSLDIHDLPQLNSITFRQYSFRFTQSARLNNLGTLTGLVFENYCFESVEHFTIKCNNIIYSYLQIDLPELRNLEVQDHSVKQVKVVVFEGNKSIVDDVRIMNRFTQFDVNAVIPEFTPRKSFNKSNEHHAL